MAEQGKQVLSFLIGGPGGGDKQRFDFDMAPELLTAEETGIIRELVGTSALAWLSRVADWANVTDVRTVNEVDVEAMAFLERWRKDPLLQWEHFRKTISVLTVQWADNGPASPPPGNRTERRAAARSGNPVKRSTAAQTTAAKTAAATSTS